MSQDCGHNSEMILFVPDEDARKESCIIWSEDSHPPEVEKSNHHTARQSKGGGYRTFQNKGFCFLVFFFAVVNVLTKYQQKEFHCLFALQGVVASQQIPFYLSEMWFEFEFYMRVFHLWICFSVRGIREIQG